MCRLWQGDLKGAEDDIRHAISLNASDALAHRYLSTVLVVDRPDRRRRGVGAPRVQLDPLSPASGTTVAYRLYYAGQSDEALREFDRALEGAPDYASAWIGKAQTYRALGQPERARQAVREAGPRAGGRTYVRAYAAYSLALDGDRAGARALLDQLHATATTRYVSPFELRWWPPGSAKRRTWPGTWTRSGRTGRAGRCSCRSSVSWRPTGACRLRRNRRRLSRIALISSSGTSAGTSFVLALQECRPPGRHRGRYCRR